jgi:hypothetical protein
MLYAIFCYDDEQAVGAWSKEKDDQVMTRLLGVTDELKKKGRLGPTVRLMNTTAATTVRKGKDAIVLDGPFAETKEQLLGFYVVECATLEDAVEVAKDLAAASASAGAFEIRPLRFYGGGVIGTPS